MSVTIASTRIVVGVAELRVSRDPGDTLVALALGSGLGICVYDPVAGIAGLLHAILPEAMIDPDRAARNPNLFVDSGVPRLFKECYRLGAMKERMVLAVAGGACARGGWAKEDLFQIGRRNLVMLRKLLWKNGVLIGGEDVGGSRSRSLRVDVASGAVTVASRGSARILWG